MYQFIKKFKDTRINDVPAVGGKNASLGEMITQLSAKGINVPDGFATTAFVFWTFLDTNNIREHLSQLLHEKLDHQNYSNLNEISEEARTLILHAKLPEQLATEIISAYKQLFNDAPVEVAVRSSATAEDLPQASFAGQHESYRSYAKVIKLG